jgi:lipoprotein signal peptidase
LIFAGFIFVFDQLTKWFVLDVLSLPEVQNIPLFSAGPFGLDLTMVWNRGVTFGLLSGDGPWNHLVLAGLAVAIAVFLLRWLARPTSSRQARTSEPRSSVGATKV